MSVLAENLVNHSLGFFSIEPVHTGPDGFEREQVDGARRQLGLGQVSDGLLCVHERKPTR